jgi:hypothetical protein
MERRDFLKFAATTASVIAAQGYLPLLAAEKKAKAARGVDSSNWFTEPCAIEPITGFLGQFDPVAQGSMAQAFHARYTLLHWNSAGAKSSNSEEGSIDLSWQAGKLKTSETRTNHPSNTVKCAIECIGDRLTAERWTLNSSLDGTNSLSFSETGTWDGTTMTVKSKSWIQEYQTGGALIARWAILPLLASGQIKKTPLIFDMLDDSTLRPNQTLCYEGEITVPVKDGTAKLHSYVQTGDAVVPTHYLVDDEGRVQLITMSMVNWALTQLKTQEE